MCRLALVFNEAEGIGPGTVGTSGQTITYTVTSAVNIPAGTKIRLEFSNIVNPTASSSNYKVTVTTRDAANTVIDGPSQSTAYTVKQVGTNAISDSSITSTKPAESFMKRVTLQDNAAGNTRGWNPDGLTDIFTISEPAAISSHGSFISISIVQPNQVNDDFCEVDLINPGPNPTYTLHCQNPPADGSQLHYRVKNLPAHLS